MRLRTPSLDELEIDRAELVDLDAYACRPAQPLGGGDGAQAHEASRRQAASEPCHFVREPGERRERMTHEHGTPILGDQAPTDEGAGPQRREREPLPAMVLVSQHTRGIEGVVGDDRRSPHMAVIGIAIVDDLDRWHQTGDALRHRLRGPGRALGSEGTPEPHRDFGFDPRLDEIGASQASAGTVHGAGEDRPGDRPIGADEGAHALGGATDLEPDDRPQSRLEQTVRDPLHGIAIVDRDQTGKAVEAAALEPCRCHLGCYLARLALLHLRPPRSV